MKNPLIKTAMMGLLALVTAGVAAAFYPWPERVVENDMVGKPLFEEYEAGSVRSITIVEYDQERNGPQRITLTRKGEKWVIPARSEFVATNVNQIGLAVNSLNELTVLENRSNDMSDHYEYGVVDPVEYETATNRSSLGTKIILQNRTGRELASLIIGSEVRKEGSDAQAKHFVRIPGQPNVYVVDFNTSALATDFTRWVSPNLLELNAEVPVDSIQIKNYRILPDQIQSASPQWNYLALMDIRNKQIQIQAPGNQSSDLVVVEPNPENLEALNSLGNYIGRINFTDVSRKSADAASVLKGRTLEDDTTGALDSIQEFGFFKTGFKDRFLFNASDGEVIVRTADGVAVSILLGSLTDAAVGGDNTLNHHVMLYAFVDESILPEPERPEPSDDEQENDRLEKEYLRQVKDRVEKLTAAKLRASALNQSFSPWYFIVPESVVAGLRPELSIQVPEQADDADPSSATETPAEGGADGESDDESVDQPDTSDNGRTDAPAEDDSDNG